MACVYHFKILISFLWLSPGESFPYSIAMIISTLNELTTRLSTLILTSRSLSLSLIAPLWNNITSSVITQSFAWNAHAGNGLSIFDEGQYKTASNSIVSLIRYWVAYSFIHKRIQIAKKTKDKSKINDMKAAIRNDQLT